MPCTLNGPSLLVKFTNEIGGGKFSRRGLWAKKEGIYLLCR